VSALPPSTVAASPPPGGSLERLRRDLRRLPTLAVDALLATLVMVAALTSGSGVDWAYYVRGARGLIGESGLSLYAVDPNIQLGPLSLISAAAFDAVPGGDSAAVGIVVTCVLLVPTLTLVRRLAIAMNDSRVHPAAIAAIAIGWFALAIIAQPADAVALIGVLAAMGLVAERPALAGALLAAGALFKPWTLALTPLLLAAPTIAGRVRAFATCGAVGLIGIAPFVIADPRTLDAGKVAFYVSDSTWLRFVGVGDIGPDGWRLLQLGVCVITGCMLAWLSRGASPLQVAVVIAAGCAIARLITDLGTWPYYVSVVLPLTALVDVAALTQGARSRRGRSTADRAVQRARAWPWVTTLTFVGLVNASPPLAADLSAILRLTAQALAVALTFLVARGARGANTTLEAGDGSVRSLADANSQQTRKAPFD
jgi:hypothetical protein